VSSATVERTDQRSTSKRVVWLLLDYLYSHPDAKDTAEGIANWWLRAHGVMVNQTGVEEAINELVMSGWLMATGRMASYPMYSLNRARIVELQQLVESTK
jgi:hypothetical protein